MWIKGNKSRPGGGFGRNWGHHVRGEFFVTEPRFTNESFSALEEDMAVLAAACQSIICKMNSKSLSCSMDDFMHVRRCDGRVMMGCFEMVFLF
jgi:hypothetical protein